jgi:hypothetical protein
MSLIDSIKIKLAMGKIREDAGRVSRYPRVFNLDDSKYIGVAFQYTTPEEFELLKKYVLYLREHKKKVKIIGIYAGKTEPPVQYSKVDYDFVNEKEFAWWGKPASHLVTNFIDEPFDVYIDLNFSEQIALRYIAYTNRASFRIGHYSENDASPFDLLISVPKESGLKPYLREVDNCLQKINKPGQGE